MLSWRDNIGCITHTQWNLISFCSSFAPLYNCGMLVSRLELIWKNWKFFFISKVRKRHKEARTEFEYHSPTLLSESPFIKEICYQLAIRRFLASVKKKINLKKNNLKNKNKIQIWKKMKGYKNISALPESRVSCGNEYYSCTSHYGSTGNGKRVYEKDWGSWKLEKRPGTSKC